VKARPAREVFSSDFWVVTAVKADAAIVKNAIEFTARSRRNWRINPLRAVAKCYAKRLCFKE